jgi:hypothetical protein
MRGSDPLPRTAQVGYCHGCRASITISPVRTSQFGHHNSAGMIVKGKK